jgi:S1-C subfamily serine protease
LSFIRISAKNQAIAWDELTRLASTKISPTSMMAVLPMAPSSRIGLTPPLVAEGEAFGRLCVGFFAGTG